MDRRLFTLDAAAKVVVIGAGKASLRIAEELELVLGDCIDRGLIVVPRGHGRRLRHTEVLEADHPLPSPASYEAGKAILQLAQSATSDDLVVACFTGGSSALVSLPPSNVPFRDKVELHRLLVFSGASIVEINAVRKHASAIKGGRLAAAVAPARLVNLTVSDVAGDPLDAITDLTVQDSTTVGDAIAVLHRHKLWESTPTSIREHFLASPCAESPALDQTRIHTTLLVTGESVCGAMRVSAERIGYICFRQYTGLEGDSSVVGSTVVSAARGASIQARGLAYAIVGCGGESTVAISDASMVGAGGPNQEAAIAAALALEPSEKVAIVFVDTDGADGGTKVAGGVVDHLTRQRAREVGVNLELALAQHRSTEALETLGDAVMTGATGTNVNDLFAATIAGERRAGGKISP